MAYQIPNKNPLDVTKRVAIGVSIPFNSPSVFNQTYTTNDQLRSNIINYVLTNSDERVFNPNFGLNLQAKLFDNITPVYISNIENQLVSDLQAYFPMVSIKEIKITPDYDNNSITIFINYSYLGDTNTINLEL